MPLAVRTDLEALLRDRKLDHTLATGAARPAGEREPVPTGIAPLDARLEGGLPRGQISEIVGPRSSGRTTVLFSTLAGATRRGELVVLVDALDMFDPPSAAAAGIVFDRLLWIRGEAVHAAPAADAWRPEGRGRARSRVEVVLDRAVKAVNLVLQAGGFGVVVLDLADAPPPLVRRLPFTTWMRLQCVLEGSETACLLIAPEPVARSAGGMTLALTRIMDGTRTAGSVPRVAGSDLAPAAAPAGSGRGPAATRSRLLAGLHIEARVIHARAAHDAPSSFQTLPVGSTGG